MTYRLICLLIRWIGLLNSPFTMIGSKAAQNDTQQMLKGITMKAGIMYQAPLLSFTKT